MSNIDVSHDVSKAVALTCPRHAHKSGGFRALKNRHIPAIASKNGPLGPPNMCQWLSKALQVRIQVLIGKAVKAMTRLLTIQEVKEQLSLSRSSVYRLIDEKELERVYINSAPRVVSDSVEAFIQRLRTPKSAFTNEGQQS
jgi:excisionase family DNA binding protein